MFMFFESASRFSNIILVLKKVIELSDQDDQSSIAREVKLISQCTSPFIVQHFGTFFKKPNIWVSLKKLLTLRDWKPYSLVFVFLIKSDCDGVLQRGLDLWRDAKILTPSHRNTLCSYNEAGACSSMHLFVLM